MLTLAPMRHTARSTSNGFQRTVQTERYQKLGKTQVALLPTPVAKTFGVPWWSVPKQNSKCSEKALRVIRKSIRGSRHHLRGTVCPFESVKARMPLRLTLAHAAPSWSQALSPSRHALPAFAHALPASEHAQSAFAHAQLTFVHVVPGSAHGARAAAFWRVLRLRVLVCGGEQCRPSHPAPTP